ncbi:MAG: ferrochelatase [Myxococcota bacterium]
MSEAILQRLEAADDALDARGLVRDTLAPDGRRAATPLRALVVRARLATAWSGAALQAFGEGLIALADAIAEHFPENIYWDLDFAAGNLCRRAVATPDPAVFLAAQTATLVGLQRTYGRHSTIRFRYVHDFIYGFDWAKWVAKDPATRRSVAPFDPEYLAFSAQRGRELLQLIADDDRKYHQLEGAHHRNPFGFHRDPGSERRLLRQLARTDGLPVEAWHWDGGATWSRPFAEQRRATATALGISR